MGFTDTELRNIAAVKEYMRISYSPQRASAAAVAHLCAEDNTFLSPTTFPGVSTLEEYAEQHGKLMKEISDLQLDAFEIVVAKDSVVVLSYQAHGSHCGAAHSSIEPTHRHARWSAAAIFTLDGRGKLKSFEKQWDKVAMWAQLGWPLEECVTRDALAALERQLPVTQKLCAEALGQQTAAQDLLKT